MDKFLNRTRAGSITPNRNDKSGGAKAASDLDTAVRDMRSGCVLGSEPSCFEPIRAGRK